MWKWLGGIFVATLVGLGALYVPPTVSMAQQSYPLVPFQCPAGQFTYAFNPVTGGLPGWFCAVPGVAKQIVTPPATTVGDLAVWGNTNGTSLIDNGTAFPSITVANNNALKALPVPTAGTVAYRAGFATAGDGGGATYTFATANCTISGGDNGSQVQPTTGTGCWILSLSPSGTSIMVWGSQITAPGGYVATPVNPSGEFDNTATFQAALNSGLSPILVPPGRFHVTNQLTCGASNQRIIGAGRLTSIIDVGTDANMSAMSIFNPSPSSITNQGGCQLENVGIQFYQNPAATATITASISGTALTVTSGSVPLPIPANTAYFLSDVAPPTVRGQITSCSDSTHCTVSVSQTVGSESMGIMAITEYPWAINNTTVPSRVILNNVEIARCWNGANFQGNFAPIWNGIIQLGCFNVPFTIDGALDNVFINHVEVWPFGSEASTPLTSAFEANTPTSTLGATSGLKANSLVFFASNLHSLSDSNSDPAAGIAQLHFNGPSCNWQIDNGAWVISNLTLECNGPALTEDGPYDTTFVKIANGMYTTNSQTGYIANHGGVLSIQGGQFMIAKDANVVAVDSSSHTSLTDIENVTLHLPVTANLANTLITQTSSSASLRMSNVTTGSSAGHTATLVSIGNDLNTNYLSNLGFGAWGTSTVSVTLANSGVLGYYNLPGVEFPLTLTPKFVTMGDFAPTGNTTTGTYELLGGVVRFSGADTFTTNAYTTPSGNFFFGTNLPTQAAGTNLATNMPITIGRMSGVTLGTGVWASAEIDQTNPPQILPLQLKSATPYAGLGPSNIPASTSGIIFSFSGEYEIH